MENTSSGVDVVFVPPPPLPSSLSLVSDNTTKTHLNVPATSSTYDKDWEMLRLKISQISKKTPYAFSNDEYGLLNAANLAVNEMTFLANETSNDYRYDNATIRFNLDVVDITNDLQDVSNFTTNITESDIVKIVTTSPSPYTIYQIVILAIIMTAMMIIIVVGNILVVIATATESNLASVQNWFIASLAVADMLIGLVIMPFSLSYELMGYWMFGKLWCDVHGALDVLLCTASIMNICLISLDRYWSITKAIAYLNTRTPRLAIIMITTTWLLSCFISIPPLLGWKEDVDLEWFWDILNSQGNRSHTEFLREIETSGEMGLKNFTDTLQTVVYPQCGVSQTFKTLITHYKQDFRLLLFFET